MFFPLVYVLTCNRTTQTYNTIFGKLKEAQPLLNSRRIMVDFEMAVMNAIESNFSQTTINGCYFHFCQSIYRHVQAYGLQSEYCNNINVASHIRYMAALAFVSPEDVFRWYTALKVFAFFRTKLASKSDNSINKLLKYVQQTWMGSKDRKSTYRSGRFPIKVWNMYDMVLNGLPRTNNATEGWCNAIRTFFDARHPQIYKFMHGVKTEQGLQEATKAQITAGNPQTKGQRKYSDLTKRLQTVVKTYTKPETFQIKKYLEGVSSSIHMPSFQNADES